MLSKNLLARAILVAAVIGSMSLSIGSASAVIVHTCPDGTRVVDFKQCPLVEAQEYSPGAAHLR
jgi:hypothetical protein